MEHILHEMGPLFATIQALVLTLATLRRKNE